MPNFHWNGTWRGRHPASDPHTRARKVIRPSGGIMRGKFPSRKTGRMVHHEGLLELDAIYLFETHPRIARYREQPITLHYPDGPRLRRYTPDFELVTTDGQILYIEIKPTRRLMDPDIRHTLDCIAAHMTRCDHRFAILDSDVIRLEPRLSNLRWIYHQAARRSPTQELARITMARTQDQFPLPFGDAARLLSPHHVDPATLLLMGWLRCDLDAPINSDTQLHTRPISQQENDHGWIYISQELGF